MIIYTDGSITYKGVYVYNSGANFENINIPDGIYLMYIGETDTNKAFGYVKIENTPIAEVISSTDVSLLSYTKNAMYFNKAIGTLIFERIA